MFEDTFKEMRKMQEEMNKLFNRVSTEMSVPGFVSSATDISETGDSLVITTDMPGVNKEDIQLKLTEDSISIKAERKGIVEEERKGFYRKERSYKGYNIFRTLPVKVKPETAEAEYKNGVLKVTVEKSEKIKEKEAKKIEVK